MIQSGNKSKKYSKNLDHEAGQKLCEAVEKRMRTIFENLDDVGKEKLQKSSQKREQTMH